MPRLLAASTVLFAVGATLVLSELRWFRRQPLVDRLRPYGPGGFQRGAGRSGILSVASFREVIGPLARHGGERIAGMLGVTEDVAIRLGRTHADVDVTAFRVRQLGWAAAGFGAGALLAAATQPPLAIALLFAVGGP